MIRFDSAPELNGVLIVGTKVRLQWNLKMRANITLYQRYETPVGAYSKFIDHLQGFVIFKDIVCIGGPYYDGRLLGKIMSLYIEPRHY